MGCQRPRICMLAVGHWDKWWGGERGSMGIHHKTEGFHQTEWMMSQLYDPMPNMTHEAALQRAKLPQLGFFPTCLPYRAGSFPPCTQRQCHLCGCLSAAGPLDCHKALFIFKTSWVLILDTHWVLTWLLGCLENDNYWCNSAHRICDTLSKKDKPYTGGRCLLPKIY